MRPEQAYVYVGFWVALLLASLVVAVRQRSGLRASLKGYGRALRAPWKLVTYVLSAGPFIVLAPYSGDPTWDHVDAAFMSGLTILTAPWSLGTLYRAGRGTLPKALILPAVTVWLFSASWSYDLYIWWRDGHYPPSWFWNLIASSVLYVAAGMLWSLDHRAGRGVHFAFQEPAWALPSSDLRIVGYGLAFILLVVGMMLPFAWDPIAELLQAR
jgi:hypothetical protein